MTAIRDMEGVVRGGDKGIQLPVKYLRFWEGNQRLVYGFNPKHEKDILDLIKQNYVPFLEGERNFPDAEKNFILENLIDPVVESDERTEQYRQSMKWLADDIAWLGVQTPLTGFWDYTTDEFYTTDGNRRLAAIVVAKLQGKDIQRVSILKEDADPRKSAQAEKEYLRRQIITNSGRQLSPIEEANVIKRMLAVGYTEKEVADLVGNIAIVRQRLRLLDLPEKVQDAVAHDLVKPTAAIKVADAAIDAGYTHKDVEQAVEAAIEVHNEEKKVGKTRANKVSAKDIEEKLEAQPKPDKPKAEKPPRQEIDRESVVDEFQELISSQLMHQLDVDTLIELMISLLKSKAIEDKIDPVPLVDAIQMIMTDSVISVFPANEMKWFIKKVRKAAGV